MDGQIWLMLLKIIIFLPFVLLLIYISAKFGGSKLQSIQNGRYIKVLERVPLSKENNLMVVKIGEKGYIMSSTQGKVEILMDMNDGEIQKVQNPHEISQYTAYEALKEFYKKNNIDKLSKIFKFKKEDRDE